MRIVNLDEASRILGITPDAIRKRVQRGTIQGYKDKNGRWKVNLEDEPSGQRAEDSGQLVDALQKEIDFLRKELERKDHILMALTNKIPLLEAPKEKRRWWQRIFK